MIPWTLSILRSFTIVVRKQYTSEVVVVDCLQYTGELTNQLGKDQCHRWAKDSISCSMETRLFWVQLTAQGAHLKIRTCSYTQFKTLGLSRIQWTKILQLIAHTHFPKLENSLFSHRTDYRRVVSKGILSCTQYNESAHCTGATIIFPNSHGLHSDSAAMLDHWKILPPHYPCQ